MSTRRESLIRSLRAVFQPSSSTRKRLIELEAAVRDSEARKIAILNSAFDAVVMIDGHGIVLEINAAAERMFGYSHGEAVGRELAVLIVPPELREKHRRALAHYDPSAPSAIVGQRVELDAMRANGERFPIELSVARAETADNVVFTAWIRDMTEQRRADAALKLSEAQLRQAQKMEAVGRLAGGVAHDFNNVLTAIFGYADLLIDSFEPHHPGRADLLEIKRAAERAANLTRQLLAFSRKQVLQPRRVGVNTVVANMEPLLRRLIGDDIELCIDLDGTAGEVRADPGQLEQVLMNLAVNARDAMPEGGQLAISTANVSITADAARGHDGFQPGTFVRLNVTDTGEGIPENVRRHIFEPFFTTKEQGKGTGLGLATVYGIVKQSGGWIYVSSEPGAGTTFSIYLSRVDAGSVADTAATSSL
jgi:PAS domain S-box-containing protein